MNELPEFELEVINYERVMRAGTGRVVMRHSTDMQVVQLYGSRYVRYLEPCIIGVNGGFGFEHCEVPKDLTPGDVVIASVVQNDNGLYVAARWRRKEEADGE